MLRFPLINSLHRFSIYQFGNDTKFSLMQAHLSARATEPLIQFDTRYIKYQTTTKKYLNNNNNNK